jgi:hypothetical protein
MTASPRRPLSPGALTALALAFATGTGGAACSEDGAGAAVDANVGPDAPACTLPATVVNCTVGDDSPCTALCVDAYCFNDENVGVVCTEPCTTADDCAAGWSCNNRGRCRPPT